MVLEGGIKGWVKAGPEYTRRMDGFKKEHWEKLFTEEEAKQAPAGDSEPGR